MPCIDSSEIGRISSTCNDCCYVAYLLWQHAQSQPGPKALALKKWFKLVVHHQAEDAFWCPKDECMKNLSNLMLAEALTAEDTLYWEMDATKPPSPKRKKPQAKEELLNDSVLMVQTTMSVKKHLSWHSKETWQQAGLKLKHALQVILKQWLPKSPPYHSSWKWYLQCNKMIKQLCLDLTN